MTIKERLVNAVLLTLSLCAVAATVVTTSRILAPHRAPPAAPMVQQQANWRDLAVGQRIGPAQAAVTIVEFSDFQCPFCRTLAHSLSELRKRYPDRVAIVFRHYPLEKVHPFARGAALAAECAGQQGAFAPYHDLLFALQDSLGHISWDTYARRAGVKNITQFADCVKNARLAERVDGDVRVGEAIGVQGTPTILINDRRLSGAPSPGLLDSLVRMQLPKSASF